MCIFYNMQDKNALYIFVRINFFRYVCTYMTRFFLLIRVVYFYMNGFFFFFIQIRCKKYVNARSSIWRRHRKNIIGNDKRRQKWFVNWNQIKFQLRNLCFLNKFNLLYIFKPTDLSVYLKLKYFKQHILKIYL